MFSRSSGLWVTTLSIFLLFIQGNSGKDLAENTGHEEGDRCSIGRQRIGLGCTWNDRMKNFLVTVTGMVPPVGGVPIGKMISFVLKIFWPYSEPDIWSLIKDQVKGLIDEKILDYELQERRHEIRALQKTMQMYVEAQVREKGSLMSKLIHDCNELFVKLTQSSNSVQLIPLVVTHSAQHLLILKERLLHGKMYDEDNTDVWRKELEDQISTYKDYIKDIYSKWVTWRNSKIIVDVGVTKKLLPTPPFFRWEPYGNVHDELTDDEAIFVYSPIPAPNNPNYFRLICEAVKMKWFRFWNGKMLQVLVPTFFYLDNFIPGNEDNPSVTPSAMSIASFGPISYDLDGGNERSRVYTPGDDNKRGSDVTKIIVREWNIIDGFQVVYGTHSGRFYGNSGAGQLHEFPLNNSRVRSIQFCYNNCNQVEMTIGFSNGDSTGRLGNRGGWSVTCVNTGDIDTYGLFNIRATDNGCTKGLYQVGVDYKAYSVRPSEIDNRAQFSMDLENMRYASAIDTENS